MLAQASRVRSWPSVAAAPGLAAIKEKLQAFAESIGEKNSPIHESFFEKAKKFFNNTRRDSQTEPMFNVKINHKTF